MFCFVCFSCHTFFSDFPGSCDGTMRLKNALISESDDFGPMGGRYQLQTEDQHNNSVTGMCAFPFFLAVQSFLLWSLKDTFCCSLSEL